MDRSSATSHQGHRDGCSSIAAVILLILIGAELRPGVSGYPGGAPDGSCGDMVPQHGAAAQSGPSPYTVTASSSTYTAGQSITVTLSGTSSFDGFLLQARTSPNALLGTFTNLPASAQPACTNAGVTHTHALGTRSLVVTWVAPSAAGNGNIKFVATFVQNMNTYWVGLPSSALTESLQAGVTLASTAKPTAPPPFVDVDTSTCDQGGKACFRVPTGCLTGSCDYLLTWSDAGSAVSFELSASVPDVKYWVGFAMSLDAEMGEDSVESCIYNEQTVTVNVETSWNSGKKNDLWFPAHYGLNTSTLSGAVSNGRLVCRFQRAKSAAAATSSMKRRSVRQTSAAVFYPLDSGTYYILMAKGPASGGYTSTHTSTTRSLSAVNFTAYVSVEAENSRKNCAKAHGIMMMVAWMVFASSGMLLPRYFKPAWPNTLWSGKKIWFQLHQPFMVIALILTALAFIVVFAGVDGYSQLPSPTVAHAPLGIIVMALVLLNPIMALFRPDPNTKYRPLFNVAHFLVGLLAHAAAVVTMFLGMYMTELNLPTWCVGIMGLYTCFHALVEITLALHMHAAKLRKPVKPGVKEYEMQAAGQTPSSPTESSGSVFKSTLLVIHMVGVLSCCIAISVQVGLS